MLVLPTAGTESPFPFGGYGLPSSGPRKQGRQTVDILTTVKSACMAAGEPE